MILVETLSCLSSDGWDLPPPHRDSTCSALVLRLHNESLSRRVRLDHRVFVTGPSRALASEEMWQDRVNSIVFHMETGTTEGLHYACVSYWFCRLRNNRRHILSSLSSPSLHLSSVFFKEPCLASHHFCSLSSGQKTNLTFSFCVGAGCNFTITLMLHLLFPLDTQKHLT